MILIPQLIHFFILKESAEECSEKLNIDPHLFRGKLFFDISIADVEKVSDFGEKKNRCIWRKKIEVHAGQWRCRMSPIDVKRNLAHTIHHQYNLIQTQIDRL